MRRFRKCAVIHERLAARGALLDGGHVSRESLPGLARTGTVKADAIRPRPSKTFAGVLGACAQTGPAEFSASGADAPTLNQASDMDFGPMDRTTSQCKTVSRKAAPGSCTKVRAYEACMKSHGYITVLGPENPTGCGDPDWEKDVRKWLQ